MVISFIKAVLKYAHKKGYIAKDITGDIKGIPKNKVEQKPIRAFTDDELQIIFNEDIHENLKTCFHGLLNLGCRLGELQNLNWEHVDMKAKTIRIKGEKTNKWRSVPISDSLYPHLVSAKKNRDRRKPHVFSMEGGGRANDHVYDVLMKICHKNVFNDVTTHSFRHTFVQRHLHAGTDFRTIMAWTGHNDIKSFWIYLAQFVLTPEHINKVDYTFLDDPDNETEPLD